MRFLNGNANSDKISLQSLFMGALVLFGLLALICVWPAKIPEFHKDFGGLENPAFYFDTGDESPYSKEFTAVLPYVDTLDFYTKNAQPVLVHVRLWGYKTTPVYDSFVEGIPLEDGGRETGGAMLVRLHLGWILEPGSKYTVQILGHPLDYWNHKALSIGLRENGEPVYLAHCASPLSLKRTLFYDAVIILAWLLLFFLVRRLGAKMPMFQREVSKLTVGIALAICLLVVGSLAIFELQLFGKGVGDKLFLETGLVIGCLFLIVLWERGLPKLPSVGSIFFAGMFFSCVAYQNALSDYEHYLYYRWLSVFLGLYLFQLPFKDFISLLKKKEGFLTISLLWGVFCIVTDAIYIYRSHQKLGDSVLAGLNATLFTLYSFLLLIPFLQYLANRGNSAAVQRGNIKEKRKIPLHKIFYVCVTLTYISCVFFFRNGRVWPIFLFAGLGLALFYLAHYRVSGWLHLEMLSEGVLISFAWIVFYSLLHRPWHAFILYRYGMVFHTVTMTSVYLLLVLAVCVAKSFSFFSWEGLAFGCVAAFLFMTYSRNGWLSAICVIGSVILLKALLAKGFSGETLSCRTVLFLSDFGKKSLKVVFISALCFPMVFGAVRMMPALVNRPEMYWIEPFNKAIWRGTAADSEDYMTAGRFFQVLGIKSRGLPEYSEARGRSVQNEAAFFSKEPLSIMDSYLVASAGTGKPENPVDEEVSANQFANGRFSIFKAYLSQLNWTGHEEMGAVLQDGSLAVHAHNIFLQIAFDHGILTGLLFLVFSILTLLETLLYAFRSFRLCKETGEEGKLCFLPFALSVAFYTTGMAEWISHMCNPLAAAFLLALLPVMLDK